MRGATSSRIRMRSQSRPRIMDRSTLLPLFCRAFTAPAWDLGGLRVVFFYRCSLSKYRVGLEECRHIRRTRPQVRERAGGFQTMIVRRRHVREFALSNFSAVYNRDFSIARSPRHTSGYVLTQNSHFTHALAQGNSAGDRVAPFCGL